MGVRYLTLGATRRLRETVFAGSHDASITSGGSSAQTQDLEIDGQADAGVRLFDLRIAAHKQGNTVSMVGYHGMLGGKKTGLTAKNPFKPNETVTLDKTNSKITGEFGLGLGKMLKQAKTFVEDSGEFLIFKFDKCSNYPVIAEFCVEILGNNIFKPIGKEFSKLTLEELCKKVVCVFNQKVLDDNGGELGGYGEDDGILGFKSLKGEKGSSGGYKAGYSGLQYYGKGGTNWKKIYQTNKMKMSDNEGIQKEMLMAMGRVEDDYAANVLGMMYWTSTGFTSSIRVRNEETMWGDTGIRRMGELWRQGLEKSIETQMKRDQIRTMSHGGVKRMKAYFPNIIMIDFADEDKGQTIYDLNKIADIRLIKAYERWKKG